MKKYEEREITQPGTYHHDRRRDLLHSFGHFILLPPTSLPLSAAGSILLLMDFIHLVNSGDYRRRRFCGFFEPHQQVTKAYGCHFFFCACSCWVDTRNGNRVPSGSPGRRRSAEAATARVFFVFDFRTRRTSHKLRRRFLAHGRSTRPVATRGLNCWVASRLVRRFSGLGDTLLELLMTFGVVLHGSCQRCYAVVLHDLQFT